MNKIILSISLVVFLSCNNDKKKETTTTTTTTTTSAEPTDLPYKASYSSSWSTNVSDDDLKTVLLTYKYWADNNMKDLGATLGDSVYVDFSSGDIFNGTRAELMKRWTTFRDSLSSVTIDMAGWNKMYATDKKDSFIVTWYKEIDTYKSGKADSAYYHDINQLKKGKIVWYSQYKRPAK
jgi:hypothetical protein